MPLGALLYTTIWCRNSSHHLFSQAPNSLHCSDYCIDSPQAVLDSVFSQLKSDLQELTFDSQNCTSWWIQIANSSHGEYSLDFPRQVTVLKMEGSIPPISNFTSLTIGKLYATLRSHILHSFDLPWPTTPSPLRSISVAYYASS